MRFNESIVLYGSGSLGKKIIEILDFCGISIAAVIDSDTEKWGSYIKGYKIQSPDFLLEIKNCILCISINDESVQDEIRDMILKKYHIKELNEMSYLDLILYAYDNVDIKKFGINNIDISNINNCSIIFDCEYGLVLGGIEEWTKGICTEFIKKGEINAFILANYSEYEVSEVLRNNIIRVNVCGENAFLPMNIEEIIKGLVNYLPCTLVTSQPNEVLLAGGILKRYVGEKIQIVSGIRGGNDRIYFNYLRMKKYTDLYTCVSSDITKNMIKRGISNEKALTMICPISYPEIFDRKYTLDSNNPIRIGYAGRIVIKQKRMDLMVKLIDNLEKNRVNYIMEIAGEGEYELNLRNFISQYKCQNKVKLVGRLDKEGIEKFWTDKDICLNIADYEGRSRSIAEAMANGAIPIVTETSGVHDDIRNQENGYIIPIGDYNEMLRHIMMLEKNRNMLPILGNKAHLEIRNKSSMEEHYKFWINIIDNWKKTIID